MRGGCLDFSTYLMLAALYFAAGLYTVDFDQSRAGEVSFRETQTRLSGHVLEMKSAPVAIKFVVALR